LVPLHWRFWPTSLYRESATCCLASHLNILSLSHRQSRDGPPLYNYRARISACARVGGPGCALVRCGFRVCAQGRRDRQKFYAGSIVVLLKWSRKMFGGMPFLKVSERRPPLRIVFNSAECFCDRRQGHGKSIDNRKEIPFKEADCS
jgi:hypothetical protein